MHIRLFVSLLFAALPVFGEERNYSVSIDGKPAGEGTLSIESSRDETTTITSKMKYGTEAGLSFDYHGTERWKDGRLIRLEGSGAENSRKGSVSLVSGKDGYALKAGVKEVTVRGEVWPNSFWIRPEADQPLIIDVITGDVLRAKIEKIGADRINLDGKPVSATHYRVTTGGKSTELWYDDKNRLLRRKWTREGHTLVMELTQIKAK